MIVIATNNSCVERICKGELHPRNNFLDKLLESIESIEFKGDVVVVDTGSTDYKSLEYLELLKTKKFNFNLIVDSTTDKYSTSAYLYAVKKYKSEYYIFLQDSIVIKDKNIIIDIEEKLTENNIVCFVKGNSIQYDFDNNTQKEFIYNCIGQTEYDYLVFGPMFSIKGKTIDNIIDQIKLRPTNKNEDSGMERGFGVLFKKNNINIISIDDDYNYESMIYDRLKYITKFHVDRK
jgi:hypothetical protein